MPITAKSTSPKFTTLKDIVEYAEIWFGMCSYINTIIMRESPGTLDVEIEVFEPEYVAEVLITNNNLLEAVRDHLDNFIPIDVNIHYNIIYVGKKRKRDSDFSNRQIVFKEGEVPKLEYYN